MPDGLTDQVINAARDGSLDAVATIWTTLSPAVLGYLRARGVDDPEGLTSEVFVALLPRIASVIGGAAGLRTLAFSIAHARVVDDVRRRRRHPAAVEYDPVDDPRTAAAAEDVALARTSDLLRRLDALPESQREVLVLRVVADLSIEQVATILGRSEGAVKQLQRRGLLTLREILAGEGVTR